MDKKLFLFAFLIAGFIMFSSNGLATTNISSCGTLNVTDETYLLTNDILNSSGIISGSNSNGCININSNGITLDCQGHIIDGTDILNSSQFGGIYIYNSTTFGSNNTIVKNCIVTDWARGIYELSFVAVIENFTNNS